MDLNNKADAKLFDDIGKGKVICRTRIVYSSIGREYHTLTTEKIVKVGGVKEITFVPITPRSWE